MSNEQKSDSDQHQFWQMVMETFKTSGLSVRNFCKKEGLSEPAFYAWRKKLTKNDEPKKDSPKDNKNSSAFIKVSVPQNNSAPLELMLSSGNSLRISSGTDSQTLTNVLSALCEAGLC
ncbi:MAG: hypothetical protein GWP06_18835 [Actinobacteria bacterium]|nr:hypothetical protein [Actinomycetota bacterium]